MPEINLRGIIPAIVTPMTASGALDLPALKRYVSWLVEQGPVALAVNVDTGEGPHLTTEERCRTLETVAEAAAGRCGVVAGVGGPSTAQGVANARDAQSAGANALLVFPIAAFLGQPLNPELPYRYHAAIAEAVDLPLILFQLQPALGGVLYASEVLHRLIAIPTVTAIKEASFDALRFLRVKADLASASRRITLLTGNDNFIYESFVLGAEARCWASAPWAPASKWTCWRRCAAATTRRPGRWASGCKPWPTWCSRRPSPTTGRAPRKRWSCWVCWKRRPCGRRCCRSARRSATR